MSRTVAGGGPRIRTYRAPVAQGVFVTVFFGIGGLSVLGPFFTEGAPVVLLLGAVTVLAPVTVLLPVAVWYSATIVARDHLLVRRLFRTRRIAWCDVQGIEIEGNPAAVVEETQPKGLVAIYDRRGRRITLPGLQDRGGLSVHEEVRAMRELWERRRGADWAPLPVTHEAMTKAEVQTRTARAILVRTERAGLWAGGTVFVLIVLFLTLWFTGARHDLSEIPGALVVAMFVSPPAVTFLTVLLVSVRHERRR
jgi:Bacterial PH domain